MFYPHNFIRQYEFIHTLIKWHHDGHISHRPVFFLIFKGCLEFISIFFKDYNFLRFNMNPIIIFNQQIRIIYIFNRDIDNLKYRLGYIPVPRVATLPARAGRQPPKHYIFVWLFYVCRCVSATHPHTNITSLLARTHTAT